MKRMKRIVSILLAMVMVLGMSMIAFADESNGSITINASGDSNDETTVSVAGKTFKAYQILTAELVNNTDAEGGIVYRVPEDLKTFYATEFGLDASAASFDQDVTEAIADLKTADALQLFAEKALQAAKDAGIEPGTVTASEDDESVKIENLPLGYYVVEDAGEATPISALALTTTAKDVDIKIKASQPVIDKSIDGDNDTDPATKELVKYNNTSVGDTVPYVLKSSVPDMTGYKKYFFVVTDTLSKGLTFNEDVVITIDGETLDEDAYTVTSVTDEATGETTVEIVFKDFIQYKELKGAPIEIKYSATVNENAVIGVEGNPNKVTLEYSTKPNVTPDGDPENPDKPGPEDPTGETPESKTYTYTTGLQLTKVDNKGNRLTGAEFQIEGTRLTAVVEYAVEFVPAGEGEEGEYWKLLDGTYTTTAPEDVVTDEESGEKISGTADLYENTTIKYNRVETVSSKVEPEELKISATVDASGILKFDGLGAGVYTITEIKAPNGYNLLKAPITVKIDCAVPDEESTSTNCTWSAAYTFDALTAEQLEAVGNATVAQLVGNANEAAYIEGVTFTALGGNIAIDVVNTTGSLLPSTGGIGTTIFYVAGSILVLAAVVLLVTKKRMSKEK